MSNASAAKGGLLFLFGCLVAVALSESWTARLMASPSPTMSTEIATLRTPQDFALLAIQVAAAYKPGDPEEKFRLGSRKLVLDAATRDFILHDLNDPALDPSDPVKNKDALRRILMSPVTTPDWPEEAVRTSTPDSGTIWTVSLSDPVPDPKVPRRYYFLSGRGEEYYDGLGLLTVDVPADGGAPALQYDIFMSLHPPMK